MRDTIFFFSGVTGVDMFWFWDTGRIPAAIVCGVASLALYLFGGTRGRAGV